MRDDVWPRSREDFLLDVEVANACEHQGYVWGAAWQEVYPGMALVADSALAADWSARLGFDLRHAVIEANVHRIELVFRDLMVDEVPPGHRPFET